MATFDYRLKIGALMTVWRVTYTWHAAERGCPPSHYHGATPDEPAHAEIDTVELVHLGGAEVAAAHTYRDNEDTFRASRDGDFAWGPNLWGWVQDLYADRVAESERLQRHIERHETANAGLE